MNKPCATDYLPFLEAARGHEENARASGSLVDAELARLMHREAVNLRQAALYPPERCIDCGGTIHSDQRQCWNMVTIKAKRGKPRAVLCGRARQGVRVGGREVANLARFMSGALGYTKVTKAIVAKVRDMSAGGKTGRRIAEELDISRTAVSDILLEKPRTMRRAVS